MHVPSQAVYEINVKSSQPFLLRDVLPDSAWEPSLAPVRNHGREMNSLRDVAAEDGNCLMGAVVGLCVEGAIALGLFCIWQGWHLFR